MPIVEVPGAGPVEFPDSMSLDQITKEVRKMVGMDEQNPVSGSAYGQLTANRYLSNMANVPDLVANLGARSLNKAARFPQFMGELAGAATTGNLAEIGRSQPLIDVPALGQDFVPGPTGEDLMGAVQRFGETAGAVATGDFNQFQRSPASPYAGMSASEQQGERVRRLAEENPGTSMLANISGDVLTLMTARSPISAGRGRSQLLSKRLAERASSQSGRIELSPNVGAALRNITSESKSARTLLNRAGRAAETGLEGFTLAALNGEADPAETFGYAAGTQAAGSLLLSGMGDLVSGGIPSAALKLTVAAASIGGLVQVFKSSTPGGNDFTLESLETGFDKVALGLLAGIVSGGAGLGRVTSKFPVRALPDVADAITALPRSATLSLLTEVMQDPAADAVMNRLANDPQYFTPSQLRRLQRGVDNGSISQAIESLMEDDRTFREKFDQLD